MPTRLLSLRLLASALSLAISLAAPVPPALALDPARLLTQYQRRSWGPENGLPSSNVLSVTQGSNGYLWLGTEEGLVRFDGVRSQVFNRTDGPDTSGNIVYNVREDCRHPGEFILGTSGGLCRLTAAGTIAPFPATASLASLPGSFIYQDPVDGAMWVRSARGLILVTPDGKVTGPVAGTPGWPTERIRAVARDGAGRLWLGTVGGLYRQQGDENGAAGRRFELLPGWEGKMVDCLLPAKKGGLWVGSRDPGIGRLTADGVFHSHPALAGRVVRALLEDRSGMLWVGTDGAGVFRLPASDDPGAGPPPAALTKDDGLLHNSVNDLWEDREGNLWIGTQGGLQVLGDARFVNYGRPEGLTGDDVRSVFEDARGRVWIGHENGLGMLPPGAERVIDYPVPLSPNRSGNNRVLSLAPGDDADTLLAGTDAGLARWREGKVELLPVAEELDRSAVRALCRDAAGDLWVGTDNGLFQLRGGAVRSHLSAVNGLAGNLIHALHLDRRGNLWIGSSGGLNRRSPDGRLSACALASAGQPCGAVLSLFEAPTGAHDLFAGTYSGLYRLRVAEEGNAQATHYTVLEGLFDNGVWGLLGDAQGRLWMSSNKGISRVALADFARLDRGEISSLPHVAYGMDDGMRSREANGAQQPCAWRDHLGRLWFATVRGAAMVDPAQVAVNPTPPPVQVEELLADGRVAYANAATDPRPRGDTPPLPLAAGTQKLDFRYTALSLINPEANRFRYWLEGFDAGWTDAGPERAAHYTNLAPGDYVFHVQAANADGVWNRQGAAMAFHLRPFAYQTGWFRTLTMGTALVLLGILQYRLRGRWQRRLTGAETKLRERERTAEILRLSKEQAEQAHRAAEEARREAEAARAEAERANEAKSEFLSRMSHELRTPLNAILGFGQLLEVEELSSRQTQSVHHIVSGGRHLLNLVNEILDISRIVSGEAKVSIEEVELLPLIVEVVGLIEPLAQDRRVSVRLAPEPRAVHLQADRQRLKQVLLNLVANAIKYNRLNGGEVRLEVQAIAPPGPGGLPRARILIRDNGAGIAPEDVSKLFTPFERLSAAYGSIKGTGLGLTISKQLVEAMGGAIGVESVLGVGSTFWVELPACPQLLNAPAPYQG